MEAKLSPETLLHRVQSSLLRFESRRFKVLSPVMWV